jgi:hypothetical protein
MRQPNDIQSGRGPGGIDLPQNFRQKTSISKTFAELTFSQALSNVYSLKLLSQDGVRQGPRMLRRSMGLYQHDFGMSLPEAAYYLFLLRHLDLRPLMPRHLHRTINAKSAVIITNQPDYI